MKIKITSLPVKNQAEALKFYTETLGFVKKTDIPMGEHSWLTVVSKEEQDGVELLLEPMGFEPAQVYQKALFEAGIPWTAFYVDNLDDEFARLTRLGVQFSVKPTAMGTVKIAVLDDTCGNNIQLVQMI